MRREAKVRSFGKDEKRGKMSGRSKMEFRQVSEREEEETESKSVQ